MWYHIEFAQLPEEMESDIMMKLEWQTCHRSCWDGGVFAFETREDTG